MTCKVFHLTNLSRTFTPGGSKLWWKSYLPGTGDTLINKGVLPGRGLSIALRWADPCDRLKCRWLGCVISWWGGLRSRYPLHNQLKARCIGFALCSLGLNLFLYVMLIYSKTDIVWLTSSIRFSYESPFDYINILTYKPDQILFTVVVTEWLQWQVIEWLAAPYFVLNALITGNILP